MNLMTDNKKNRFGFTFVEILIVLAIISALSTIIIMSFSSIGGKQSLEKTTISVISILNEAKSMAISSKDFFDYGVRIEGDKLTSFKGNYGNENKVYEFSNFVNISDISIDGINNNDVIFKKVSGSTSATGTVTISVTNNLLENNTIRISQTGLVEKI